MEAVVGLLLMILGVSHGGETYCDGRQSGAQCYGALRGTMVIRLMDNDSQIFRWDWMKGSSKILAWRDKKIISNIIEDRSLFNPSDGTFRISDLSRNDSGQYDLKCFDSNGSALSEQTLQLTIQAPVSSVRLVSECLSRGENRVSCSSDGGDSPQYSWTLDGHSVTDAKLLSGNNETQNITLKQDVSGQLVCSVRNHISSVSREEMISTCGFIFINCTSNGTHISEWVFEANNTLCIKPTTAPTTVPDTSLGKETVIVSNKPSNQTSISDEPWYISYLPLMAGVLSALVIFLVVGLAVIWAQKKKQRNNKPKEEENDQELTYADVRVVKQQGRQAEQRPNVEVEYGQVKFSARPRQTEPKEDDCVYAMVRKDR